MNRLSPAYLSRAARDLNLRDFSEKSTALPIFKETIKPDVDAQYILRMMLRSDSLPVSIPDELSWMTPTIRKLIRFQEEHGLHNPFIYVTVRHGIVSSVTDDLWHVDGFSMRFPHVPEQNYIYTDVQPTEVLENAWTLPDDFDPFRHNIHHFFQQRENEGTVKTNEPDWVYAIDPYCVHRRPDLTEGRMRTFWRLSFVPIEIEDDTCTPNPLFHSKHYGRQDIRHNLVSY